MNVWVAGFVAWLILLVVTFRYCSGWRSHMWAYGLAPLVLLVWYAPEMALSSDGKAVREIVTTYGFWVAAVYLGVLLIAEMVNSARGKLKADS